VCEGVVKSVSQRDLVIYMVSPMPADRLNKVNTILKGSVTLPDQFFLKQVGML
jgi:hypothetical protein